MSTTALPESVPPPTGPKTPKQPVGGRVARSGSLRDRLRSAQRRNIAPMEDYGWFGPDSVAWRVWSYPTSVTFGFSRAVVVEELDPFLIAPVKNSSKIYTDAAARYDRTLRFFSMYLFADSGSITKAAEILTKVHTRVASPDPVSGLMSDPNNPDSQLWIHMTAWHSILYAYEIYGPGRLSPDDENQFWADCVTAAHAQTIDPATVPSTRDEVRAYFAGMRPRLAASESSQEAMQHLMDARGLFPNVPLVFKPVVTILATLMRAGVIASMPRYQRDLGNVRQPRIVDVAVRPLIRTAMRIAQLSPRLKMAIVSIISPSTVPIAGPALLGIAPTSDEILTPAESFRRHDRRTPVELYAELAHDQTIVIYPPSAPLPPEVAATYSV